MKHTLGPVQTFLSQRIGLAAASLGDRSLESVIRRRMAATASASPLDYLAKLLASTDEAKALVESVVVPESWFYRYPESFALLVETAQARKPTPSAANPYRVLSCPCSTGEEAYSATIALRSGNLSADAVQVYGVDISTEAIAKATAGSYFPASFRESEPKLFTLLLQSISVLPSGKREVDAAIKASVKFQQVNVVDPTSTLPPGPFDAIFCRNLLIYLTDDARATVLKRLTQLLSSDGIMFLGHAEGTTLANYGMESIGRPQAFAFRKRSVIPTHTEKTEPKKVTGSTRTRTPQPQTMHAVPPPQQVPTLPIFKMPVLDLLEQQINSGLVVDVLPQLEMHAAEQPSPRAYTLLGVALQSLGRSKEAEQAFTQALYIDPKYYDALMQLFVAASQRGDTTSADNYRRRIAKANQDAGS